MRSPKKRLEAKLDKTWSEVIRGQQPVCFYPDCGRPTTSAHHIFSRRRRSTRWLPDNGIGLCTGHHTYAINSAHQDPEHFRDLLIAEFGQDWFDRLKYKANSTTKWSMGDLEMLGEEMQEELKRSLQLKELQ